MQHSKDSSKVKSTQHDARIKLALKLHVLLLSFLPVKEIFYPATDSFFTFSLNMTI